MALVDGTGRGVDHVVGDVADHGELPAIFRSLTAALPDRTSRRYRQILAGKSRAYCRTLSRII
jgi:hypothetical protein